MEVTRKKLAELMNVSVSTINNWSARGKLPKQNGNKKGYAKEAIIQWAKSKINAMKMDIEELEKLIESLE